MTSRRRRRTRVIAFSGASGAGKTSLLVKLIPALVARGVSVAALKRSGHPHPLDRPGKDSARLRSAGAVAVAVQGPLELAWFGPPLPGGVAALAKLLPPVDLVVAEGFKDERVPRVEVHRSAVGRTFLCARDTSVIAIVSDRAPPRPLPWFTAREVEALADFVARFTFGARWPPERALASRRAHAHRLPGGTGQPREEAMARTTKRTSGPRGRARTGRSSPRRTGGATVSEAGRKGGRRTLERRGPEFYSRIGRKGGKSSGSSRRSAAPRSRRGSSSRTRSTTGGRGRGGARRKSSR